MLLTNHQLKQQEIVDQIALKIRNNSLSISNVSPVDNYSTDQRICFTSIHFPHQTLLNKVQDELISSLKKIEPTLYYYPNDGLHITIKNIRTISNPPSFTEKDINKAKKVFDDVISSHHKFSVYFYRLLLFPNTLALIGTTDEEFDNLISDLDKELKKSGIPDNKVYANNKYFFSNMSLARFNTSPSKEFKQKVEELSKSLLFEPYLVDSAALVTCNAVFQKRNVFGTWMLD